MTDETLEPDADIPFGEELLEALRSTGLPLIGMSYAEIQQMKLLDREGAIRMLRQNTASLSYAMIQIIKTKSAQEIAQLVHQQHAAAAAGVGNVMPFLILMSMM